MKYINQIQDALTNFMTTKLRSALAILGILVGTASVVAMVLSGQLATHQVLQQFKALGTDLLAVSINPTSRDSQKNKLDLTTALNLKQVSPDLLMVAPYTNLYLNASFNGHKIDTNIIGTTDDLAKIIKLNMLEGRFVSSLDRYSPFCVLGYDAYLKIKHLSLNPIGQQIRLGKDIFTIIGIAKHWEENSFIYANLNRAIFIPLETSLLINQHVDIYNIVTKLSSNANIDETETKINEYFQNTLNGQKTLFSKCQTIY